MEKDFKDKYAIVGLGMVVNRELGVTGRSLQCEAVRMAIEDAGLEREDIDGSIELRRAGGGADRMWWTDAYPRVLGLPVKFYYSIGRGAVLAALGIITAKGFLDNEMAKYIVLCGAVVDWSQAQEAKMRAKGHKGLASALGKEGYWGTPFGDLRAVSHHSFFAARHMYEYGTTSKQFAAAIVAERQWAQMNPLAQMYGKPLTIEEHQNSPIVVWPYHLNDICQVSNGAVAFIMTTADRAKDRPKRPIYVKGVGFGEHMEKLWWEKKNYTQFPSETAVKQAFGQAGITTKDVDVAEFPDCFTAEILFHLEDYGFCKKGEGGAFVEAGHTAPGGDTPCNTYGGWNSAYHLGDLSCFHEAAVQLRGEAGERQVKDAEIALASGGGGEILSPGMCSMHSIIVLGR